MPVLRFFSEGSRSFDSLLGRISELIRALSGRSVSNSEEVDLEFVGIAGRESAGRLSDDDAIIP
jgi:hypothetical protein